MGNNKEELLGVINNALDLMNRSVSSIDDAKYYISVANEQIDYLQDLLRKIEELINEE